MVFTSIVSDDAAMDPTPKPEQTPEGRRLQRARKLLDLSLQEAAGRAGISNSWWRNVENGYEQKREQYIPVNNTPPFTLAKMARAVGVTPDQLREDGRDDAATELEQLMAADAQHIEAQGPTSTADVISAIERNRDYPEDLKRALIVIASTAAARLTERAETDHETITDTFERRRAV